MSDLLLFRIGSFNFNYDQVNNRGIIRDYEITEGINCYDCFVFMGAGFLAIIEGNVLSRTVGAEIKFEGGAGYSLNLAIYDPVFYGSNTFHLFENDAEMSYLPLLYGLELGISLDTIDITLAGSLGFTGEAQVKGKNMLYMKYGVMYAAKKMKTFREYRESTQATKVDVIRPFTELQFAVSAELTGEISVSFGYPDYVTLESTVIVSNTVISTLLIPLICNPSVLAICPN